MNLEAIRLIKKIDVLLPYANIEQVSSLTKIKNRLLENDNVSIKDVIKRRDIEKIILNNSSPSQRQKIEEKLERLDCENREPFFISDVYDQRISHLEDMVRRLVEKPRHYERQAEEKLFEIDEKFRALMNINDKSSSITEQIGKVSQLESKLSQLETDAQEILNGISTVQLGKQYLEAKNQYSSSVVKRKFSRSKSNIIRYFYNIFYYFLWLLKRIFQKDFFLYLGFILSLVMLALTYAFLMIMDISSYKDLILTVPMLWLAWFFQRKINTREKLYEVYNHKQKVMETYVAFKNSVYTFAAEDKMEEVLLEAIKKDPSDCIGKDNTTMVETILDKLRGLFISNRAKKIIKEELNCDN